jgi:MFS family permease
VGAAPSPRRLRANVACIQAMSFSWMFMLIMPVIVPYMRGLGLDMRQVYQVQAIFAVTIVVLEVPSGYVSDLLGRKRCLVAAGFLHGVAFTVLARVDGFWGVAAFEFLGATAVCLHSGTDVALLYDSLESLGAHETRRRTLGQRLFWMQSGETSAALLVGVLAFSQLRDVAFWNALVGWSPFLFALALVDAPRAMPDRGQHLANFKLLWHELFRRSRRLRLVFTNLVAYGLATLLAVWAFQDYWGHFGLELWMFGYVWAGYNLAVALVGRAAHSIEARLGEPGTIALIGALPIIGFGGMALCAASGWLAAGVLLGFAFQVGRGLTQVVLKDELNANVPAELRATANSMSSLGVRLCFAGLGPLLGFLIDRRGHAAAFGAYALLALLALVALNLPLVRRLRRATR